MFPGSSGMKSETILLTDVPQTLASSMIFASSDINAKRAKSSV